MFGFGPSIVNWMQICYNNIENCVLNSGWSTDFILSWRGELEKVAPFRFTFLCWSSCQKKSEKKKIKGIMISQNEFKISHDTTLTLDGLKKSLLSALQVLENFKKIFRLKLYNKQKPFELWHARKVTWPIRPNKAVDWYCRVTSLF